MNVCSCWFVCICDVCLLRMVQLCLLISRHLSTGKPLVSFYCVHTHTPHTHTQSPVCVSASHARHMFPHLCQISHVRRSDATHPHARAFHRRHASASLSQSERGALLPIKPICCLAHQLPVPRCPETHRPDLQPGSTATVKMTTRVRCTYLYTLYLYIHTRARHGF